MLGQIKRKRVALLAGLSFAIVAIFATAIAILYFYHLESDSTKRLHNLNLLTNQIIYHDEVLTMSARIGVYRGSPKWRERYNEHAELLDKAIMSAMEHGQQITELLYKTSQLNVRLIELETQAFDLVNKGNREEAETLLFSDTYSRLKAEYDAGIQAVLEKLKQDEAALNQKNNRRIQQFSYLIVFFGFVSVVIGIYLLSYFRANDKAVNELIITDVLTGLKNRRYFNLKLLEELNRSSLQHQFLMLGLLDLDEFKGFNDTYGHPRGDDALTDVGAVLKRSLNRAVESAYRLGGEEFAIICVVEDQEQGREVAQRIVRNIAEMGIEHKENKPHGVLTLSMGIAFHSPGEKVDSEALYRIADKALYQAKDEGRNKWVEYQLPLDPKVSELFKKLEHTPSVSA